MLTGFWALAAYSAAGAAFAGAAIKVRQRLGLSRAKHRSLTGHARMAKRAAALVPFYEYDDETVFRADAAPEAIVAARRAGLAALSALYATRFARTVRATAALRECVSDLQFVDAYRVPFQFRRLVSDTLSAGSVLERSSGVTVTDLDGNTFYDLTGSYGVNLLGYDFYKSCLDTAAADARDLGPVLGPYHPAVADNVRMLKRLSGMDEVSFHMSGTEAVMQAVQLARYHTGRSHLVRFCGAYHGWWGDVQPGIGNPARAPATYTLAEMSDLTLDVLRRRKDIACVLVNPLQALHLNAAAPSDTALLDSVRHAHFDRDAYTAWLRRLREVCTQRRIVLILDEVFLGFRLGPGGAQDYFGVRADLVTYGKTLGGGLPVGVVCGRRHLMKRYRDERPADICFARGTFNSHPYVMTAMRAFLRHLETPDAIRLFDGLDEHWNSRAAHLNGRLEQAGLPVEVANLSSVWIVQYTRPARYNWMFQFYLRAEGLALSWVGTGRLIFSLNYTDADFAAVADRFVAAAEAMQRDGWWWSDPAATNKSIRRTVLREMLSHRFKRRRVAADPS